MNLPIVFVISLVLTITSQLPIVIKNEKLPETASPLNLNSETTEIVIEVIDGVTNLKRSENVTNSKITENVTVSDEPSERTSVRNTIRPGMVVNSYAIELEPDEESGTFSGRVVIVVNVDEPSREDDIIFHISDDMTVSSVEFAIGGGSNFMTADFEDDDGFLTIDTGQTSTLYTFLIEYEGKLSPAVGLFSGSYGDGVSYLAMNLHPTNARRVFPCIDELTEASTISLTFNGVDYPHIVSNSMLEENSQTQFRPLQGPAHLWGLMAHNFAPLNNPVVNLVSFNARNGVTNQERQASLAINSYMTWLTEWTQKTYTEIILNQDGMMHVFAVPDVSIEWNSLSIVGVWEPYILMEQQNHAIMQRKTALVAIAEAMARQWFGYVIYPENWIHNWVLTGLGSYAAYEAVKDLETNPNGPDDSLLDAETMLFSDVIQESLYYDSYSNAPALQPGEFVYGEDDIRKTIYGLVKYKAPAIISLLGLVLNNDDSDFIRTAARGLFISRSLQTVNTLNFIDAINSEWMALPGDDRLIGNVEEFLGPYITSSGYPVVRVLNRQGGVTLTQQHFGFSNPSSPQIFEIPISFTRSIDRNFDNVYPAFMLDTALYSQDMDIGDEDDWVIYNIQGKGYYRVNYDNVLMERLIRALEDPDRREEIHPLNRATLVDDSLNLARGGLLTYDLAFQVVLTMQHETEYAPWKAFVKNMDFLRKRLEALVDGDDDLNPDIYLTMVRQTIGAVENELGFEPTIPLSEPAMARLTRGIVMDHACRAGYDPCIAAAIDWFYDPSADEPTVNPNIPHDIRPAVFCTMVRVGDEDVIAALHDRLEVEPVMYERVVILESLGCSQDSDFINSLLLETIASNSRYNVEERVKIFKAVASASHSNAKLALNFLSSRTNLMRNSYGGDAKLEECIFHLAENMVDGELADLFNRWIFSVNSDLGPSEAAAKRADEMIKQDLAWADTYLETVYEWIEENDATTAALSMFLVCLTFALTLFNH